MFSLGSGMANYNNKICNNENFDSSTGRDSKARCLETEEQVSSDSNLYHYYSSNVSRNNFLRRQYYVSGI